MFNFKSFLRDVIKIPIGYFLLRLVKKKTKEGLTIFVYHEVTDYPSQFSIDYGLAVSIETFRKQVIWIKNNFNIIHPQDLMSINDLPPFSAIISFDDGMKSSFENGLKILEEMNIPSIFFLNMSNILHNNPLESAFISYLGKNSNEFKLFCESRNIQKPYHLTLNPTDKLRFLKVAKDINYKTILEYQGNFANIELIHKWSNSKLVVYGNHLYEHWNASALNDIEFLQQYSENKKSMAKLQNFIDYFSFPNGQPGSCFNIHHIDLLKKLKAKKIFSSSGNINTSKNNFLLDRVSFGPFDKNIYSMWFKVGFKFINIFILKFYKKLFKKT